eukprot:353368-Chlamydomonas_euryale.AAC.3
MRASEAGGGAGGLGAPQKPMQPNINQPTLTCIGAPPEPLSTREKISSGSLLRECGASAAPAALSPAARSLSLRRLGGSGGALAGGPQLVPTTVGRSVGWLDGSGGCNVGTSALPAALSQAARSLSLRRLGGSLVKQL